MKKIFLLILLVAQWCGGNFIIENKSGKYIRCTIRQNAHDGKSFYGFSSYDLAPNDMVEIDCSSLIEAIAIDCYKSIDQEKFKKQRKQKIFDKFSCATNLSGNLSFQHTCLWELDPHHDFQSLLLNPKKYMSKITITPSQFFREAADIYCDCKDIQESIQKSKQAKFKEEAAQLKDHIKTAMPELPNGQQLPGGILGIISKYALEQKEDYEK